MDIKKSDFIDLLIHGFSFRNGIAYQGFNYSHAQLACLMAIQRYNSSGLFVSRGELCRILNISSAQLSTGGNMIDVLLLRVLVFEHRGKVSSSGFSLSPLGGDLIDYYLSLYDSSFMSSYIVENQCFTAKILPSKMGKFKLSKFQKTSVRAKLEELNIFNCFAVIRLFEFGRSLGLIENKTIGLFTYKIGHKMFGGSPQFFSLSQKKELLNVFIEFMRRLSAFIVSYRREIMEDEAKLKDSD